MLNQVALVEAKEGVEANLGKAAHCQHYVRSAGIARQFYGDKQKYAEYQGEHNCERNSVEHITLLDQRQDVWQDAYHENDEAVEDAIDDLLELENVELLLKLRILKLYRQTLQVLLVSVVEYLLYLKSRNFF